MPTYVLGSGVGDNYATLILPMVDVDWFKRAVMGALYTMAEPNNWRESGDVDFSFAVEEVAKMLEDYKFTNFNPFPPGMIFPWINVDAPPGFLLCNGGVYLNVDYPELYAALNDHFYVGEDSFRVPDFTGGALPVMTGDYDYGDDHIRHFVFGGFGGVPDVQLETSQIPAHSHEDAGHTHTIPLTATTLAVEPGEVTVLTPIPFFTQDTGSAQADIQDTGGSGFHENMPPYQVLQYVIYAGRV